MSIPLHVAWKPKDGGKVIRDIGFLFARSIVSQAISLARGMVIPSLLGPVNYGVFKIMGIYSQYFRYASLGLSSTVGRNLPIEIGRGDTEEQSLLINTSLTVVFLTNLLACLAMLVAYLLDWKLAAIPDVNYYGFLGLWLVASAIAGLLQTVLICKMAFSIIGKTEIVMAVLDLTLAIGMGLRWGLLGIMIATLGTSYLRMLIYWRTLNLHWAFALQLKRLVEYWNIGLPLTGNSFLVTFLTTAPALAVARYCDPWQIGQFGLAWTIASSFHALSYQVYTVLGQHVSQEYGRSSDNVPLLRSMVDRPTLLVSLLNTTILAVAPGPVSLITHTILPKYIESSILVPWLLLGFYYHMTAYFAGHMLNLVKRTTIYAIVNVITVGLMWGGFSYIAPFANGALPFLVLSALGWLVNSISLLLVGFRCLNAPWKYTLKLILRLIVAPLPFLAMGVWLVSQMNTSFIPKFIGIAGSFTIALASLFFFTLLFSEYKIWDLILSKLRSAFGSVCNTLR